MEQPTTPAPAPATPGPQPEEIVRNILDKLGIPGTITVTPLENGVRLQIATPEPGRLIGKHGQTLSNLQFLVNRMLLRKNPDAPRVTIDCEGYRDRQNDEVIQKCIESAERVRRWGDPVQLGPYNPGERDAIEKQFSTDVEIEAVSEAGEDNGRKKITLRIRQTPLRAPGQSST